MTPLKKPRKFHLALSPDYVSSTALRERDTTRPKTSEDRSGRGAMPGCVEFYV